METMQIIKKYYDRVGRIVSVFKDAAHKYEIRLQLYNKHGESMLVDDRGCSVSMLCYTFPNRKACFRELNNKYKRENRELRK